MVLTHPRPDTWRPCAGVRQSLLSPLLTCGVAAFKFQNALGSILRVTSAASAAARLPIFQATGVCGEEGGPLLLVPCQIAVEVPLVRLKPPTRKRGGEGQRSLSCLLAGS